MKMNSPKLARMSEGKILQRKHDQKTEKKEMNNPLSIQQLHANSLIKIKISFCLSEIQSTIILMFQKKNKLLYPNLTETNSS